MNTGLGLDLETWLLEHVADWSWGVPGKATLHRIAGEDPRALPTDFLAFLGPGLPSSLPVTLRAEALRAAGAALVNEQRQRAVTSWTVQVLEAAAIPFVVFKGGDLRYRIYPSPERRIANDVDLLVTPGSAEAALTSLAAAGALVPADADSWVAGRTHELAMSWNGVALDLHTSVLQPGRSAFRAEDVIARRQGIEIPEGRVPVPDPEDAVALVLIHAGRHEGGREYVGLRQALDILLAARAWTALDWRAVSERARRWRCRRLAGAGLWTWRGVFRNEIPDRAFDALHPGALAVWLAKRTRQVLSGPQRHRAGGVRVAQLVRKLAYAEGLQERVWLFRELGRRGGRVTVEPVRRPK